VSTSFVYGSCYPKLKIPLAGYCVLVGLSRVYSGEHFPTDVLAGALLGAGIGYTVAHFRKSIADFP
jgi:undecaprenyl-diphosphatase